jgi:hypothetical protein
MSSLLTIQHHAILHTSDNRKQKVIELWEILQQSHTNRLYEKTVLDIETVKDIITFANGSNDNKTILISFHSITHPAQNAFLKIIEEPKAGVRFILLTSNKEGLLPTLYSRLFDVTSAKEPKGFTLSTTFLITTPTERMKLPFIEKLLKEVDEEGKKNREGVRLFLLDIVAASKEKEEMFPYLERMITIASYAGDVSSSGKQLLEYTALLLPQSK